MKNLFELVVNKSKVCGNFNILMKEAQNEPARYMMNEVYKTYEDKDGNFIEQLQTTGFNARILELYLQAVLYNNEFKITKYDRPDFIVEKNGIEIAIEATTSNESSKIKNKDVANLNSDELKEIFDSEIPIRLGSALFTKLKKEYWKLPQCKNIPFVIVIENFSTPYSLSCSSSSIARYLYGMKEEFNFNEYGDLKVDFHKINTHKIKEKEIPSGFFNQSDTEKISAIIFTNSATVAKFNRMGYLRGYFSNDIIMIREGTCYNFSPNAVEPNVFKYRLNPRDTELWGEGLEIFYNPNAEIPLKRGILPGNDNYIKGGKLYTYINNEFSPFSSKTVVTITDYEFNYDNKKIIKITFFEFNESLDLNEIRKKLKMIREIAWFKTINNRFKICISQDLNDNDYGFAILDNNRYLCSDLNFSTPDKAFNKMINVLVELNEY